MIYWHSESSHMAHWPLHIFFHCAVAAPDRGETPLIDNRESLVALDPAIVNELERRELLYVRNFAPGVDVPWQHRDYRCRQQRRTDRVGLVLSFVCSGLLP